MKRVSDELREALRSLAAVESDLPGYPYDHGYLTGWHDVRRGIRRILPRGDFRSAESVEDWRKGYRDGREDGKANPGGTGTGKYPPRGTDWWPEVALGRIDPDTNEPIPDTWQTVYAERLAVRALRERTASGRTEPPEGVKPLPRTKDAPITASEGHMEALPRAAEATP